MDRGVTMSTTSGNDPVYERLDDEQIASGDLLAATHLHRYELARELTRGRTVVDLCCGSGYGSRILSQTARHVIGVDVDAETTAAANVAADQDGLADRVEFVAADALTYLEGVTPDPASAVVCFEGLEHVPDPDALADQLARLCRGETRIVVSIPNSRGFAEDNEFHATEFGYEEALDLFARIGTPTIIGQYLTEGSALIAVGSTDDPATGEAQVTWDRGAPEWANHWIAVFHAEAGEVAQLATRFRVTARADTNAYIRSLEQANAELHRTNQRLAQGWLGSHSASAASAVDQVRDLQQRLEVEKQVAFRNDELFQGLRRQLSEPRYRIVDAIHYRIDRIPVLRSVARGASKFVSGR
jgi:SAM-dependent methyltransferase